ncbi:MAG: chemotaxis protein CheX [Fibrobacter sp.]|nr:chemotaxis protein CheX [Fibrobacter sp.]
MNKQINETISSTIMTTLENLAFMFSDYGNKNDVLDHLDNGLMAQIDFYGISSGNIKIIASRSLCNLLAANILGIEPEEIDSEKKSEDALKETLNIICGRFLTEYYGENEIFTISTPVCCLAAKETATGIIENDQSFALNIEGNPFLTLVSINK